MNKKFEQKKVGLKSIGHSIDRQKKVGLKKEGSDPKISRNFTYGILGVLVLIVAGFFIFGDDVSGDGGVAAVVNGEVITISELDKALARVPQGYSISKEELLEQLIQTEVLYQAAVASGAGSGAEDVALRIEEAKLAAGLSDEQFIENLALEGITKEDLTESYSRQMAINNFIETSVIDKIEISENEIREYYGLNFDEFVVGEQVMVSHILVGDAELTAEEQESKADNLLKEIDSTNFCEYVTKHSTDVASVPTCGEYTFGRDEAFVEEFKQLSFDQEVGDIGVVKTQFGFHIIWTKEKVMERTLTLSEVSGEIEEILKDEATREEFEKVYSELASASEIEVVFEEYL